MNTVSTLFRSSLALSALMLASNTALAAAGYCSAGTAGALATSDMSFAAASASDCYGVAAGTDSLAAINALDWGKDWSLLAKLESGPAAGGSLSGLDFTLSADSGGSGNWTLSAIDRNGGAPLNLPVALDFIAVLKAGDQYAAYLFDDAVLGASTSGQWSIAYLNHGRQTPDLSHMSVYARVDGDGGVPAAIPEARTYAMMLSGLGLIALLTRRRRQAW